MHGRTEVVIFPKHNETGPPHATLRTDRVWVECEADIDRWIKEVGITLKLEGYRNYTLAIGSACGKGYNHQNVPTPDHERDYTGLAKAIWRVVDLHIAFQF